MTLLPFWRPEPPLQNLQTGLCENVVLLVNRLGYAHMGTPNWKVDPGIAVIPALKLWILEQLRGLQKYSLS